MTRARWIFVILLVMVAGTLWYDRVTAVRPGSSRKGAAVLPPDPAAPSESQSESAPKAPARSKFEDLKLTAPDVTTPFEWEMSQSFMRRGVELMEQRKFSAAVQKLSDAIAADPTNAQAFLTRANIYWQVGLMNLAIKDLTAVIDINGKRPNYVTRCTAYFVSGYWDAAIADCTEAIRLGPTETDAYLLRAMTYYSKGEWRSALMDGLIVLMIHPKDPNARHLVDQVLERMEEKPRHDYDYEGLPVIKTEMPAAR